jgi:drug/metabolite transporter (DMT)-like permease
MLGGTSTWLYSTFVYVICCLALWVLTLILGYSVADISLVGLLMAASLALVCQLIGHTICNWALKYTKAANVSSIYLLEPVGTALWVYLLWQEKPSWLVISGGILLLCGIFYFVRSEAQTEPCQNSLN